MDNTAKFLFEWSFQFIKNKDIVARKIVKIEEYLNQGYIFVEYKDRRGVYYIVPFISDFDKVWNELQEFKKATNSTDSCIVIFNSRENLDKITEKWSVVDKDQKLQIIFSNPFSTLEKRWSIMPYIHSKITEASALKQGLKALFETVDPISEKMALRMIES